MEPIVPQERGQREMVNFKDKTHPETKRMLVILPEITLILEGGIQSAEEMAKTRGWSYDRLLYWLNQYGVINPRTQRIYGESDMQFARRKLREGLLFDKVLNAVDPMGFIRKMMDTLKKTISDQDEMILKERREVSKLTMEVERLRARLQKCEGNGI
jgi:hypothetical protein